MSAPNCNDCGLRSVACRLRCDLLDVLSGLVSHLRGYAASVVERLGAEGSPTARPHLVATAAAQLSDALASNQLVTFRWYAQQYGVPAEEAKATLQEFVDANDSAHAVYLLAGSVKGDNRCA